MSATESKPVSSGYSQKSLDQGTNSTNFDPEKNDGSSHPPLADTAPDGGLTAWLVVLGGWCVAFCSFGWVNSVGVFQEYYQNNLLNDYTPGEVSWIPSLQIFLMMAGGVVFGAMFDRFGPRWLILFASFFHVFGLMMNSLATEYYQIFLAQAVCSGLGVAALFIPTLGALAGWFDKKRGLAFGIVTTGSSVGGVIFPIMTSRLIRSVGFPWAMRCCAFLLLGLLVVANLTVRARFPPQPKAMSAAKLRKPFTEPDFLLLTGSFLLLTFGIYVPLTYLPAQAQASGVIDAELIDYIIPIFNGASLFGRLGGGFLADKFGRYNVFVGTCYLSAIWVFGLWVPHTGAAGLLAFTILFGLSSGTYISLIAPLLMTISPLAEIGFRQGFIFFIASVGGLTTGPISGEILDGTGGWTGLKIFSGAFVFAGATLALISRVRQVGWKLNVAF